MNSVLIVEDLPEIRTWLGDMARTAFPHTQVTGAGWRDEALSVIEGQAFDLALIDLGLPDGTGIDVVAALRRSQPRAVAVVVTIFDDDDHLFPALQAGAFGYLLKEQPREALVAQLLRITQGEPPLSPSIARRLLGHFSAGGPRRAALVRQVDGDVSLTERETEILQRVAKGYTLPEVALQVGLSRHTVADYIKQIYRKLDVSSRAEAALEAVRRGLVNP
jgi:DNA-binding NarL/FixJ family response regulator